VPADEHVLWLGELLRVVRPGGLLAVFEHNPWNPLTVRAVDRCPFDANARLIEMPELKRKVGAAGWANPRHQFQLFFPRPLAMLQSLERLITRLPIGAQYVLYAVKK
jgi:SAM-dependent methyltransferase